MANVIITLKIMPDSPKTGLETIKSKAKKIIAQSGGEVGKEAFEPAAFGLKAIKLIFIRDEEKGGTDEIEKKIKDLKGVASTEVVDVRRALG